MLNLYSTHPNSLVELIYISQATQDMGLSSVFHLFDVCQKKNKGNEITGVLFFEKGHFAQILEGPRENVSKIWKKIQQDPRHKIVRELAFSAIDQRLFPHWALRLYGGEHIAHDLPHLSGILDGLPVHDHALLNTMRSVAKGAPA